MQCPVCDLQINGAKGVDFSKPDLTEDEVMGVCRAVGEMGIQYFLATIVTATMETYVRNLGIISKVAGYRDDGARRLVGVHLEGPCISAIEGPRGAHPLEFVRGPFTDDEFAELQRAAQGLIAMVSLAPEIDGALRFIRKWAGQVRIGLAHHDASLEVIETAASYGASTVVHFGNGVGMKVGDVIVGINKVHVNT